MTETNAAAEELLAKIRRHDATIGIVGLGYVGLPLALAFTERGFRVVGFDVDPSKVSAIGAGEGYIKHLDPTRVATAARSGLLTATADFGRLGEADAVIICVPTPLTRQREPDMTYVVDTAHKAKACLRRGQLIVLESTTYPGTTDELVRGILEQTGLRAEVDFFLAFSPEREDPCNREYHTKTIPKVVGGVGPASAMVARALYDEVISSTVLVSSARTAEAVKLTENVFRAVNIALVNELKVVYDAMGIDVWEVLDAASTKPFGFMRFNPGPGWGGHCIPLDPFYLAWKAREYGHTTRFIELAGEVNVRMPEYVVNKLVLALNDRRRAVKGSKILLLGLAYKKDIDDPRESPAFEIMRTLVDLGAVLAYHDPHVARVPRMRSWPTLPALTSEALTPALLGEQDAVIVVTDHTAVDYEMVAAHAALIVDTRGVYRAARANVVKA
jgi:UDP-N-acetyl-D-glucosamine dehydrogenase